MFGSRARGHSTARSDLDIAVELDSAPDATLSQQVLELGQRVSVPEDDAGYGLRVQVVPFFDGEEGLYLARAIEHDAETVWTRT